MILYAPGGGSRSASLFRAEKVIYTSWLEINMLRVARNCDAVEKK
jgi:hypothetical protein